MSQTRRRDKEACCEILILLFLYTLSSLRHSQLYLLICDNLNLYHFDLDSDNADRSTNKSYTVIDKQSFRQQRAGETV